MTCVADRAGLSACLVAGFESICNRSTPFAGLGRFKLCLQRNPLAVPVGTTAESEKPMPASTAISANLATTIRPLRWRLLASALAAAMAVAACSPDAQTTAMETPMAVQDAAAPQPAGFAAASGADKLSLSRSKQKAMTDHKAELHAHTAELNSVVAAASAPAPASAPMPPPAAGALADAAAIAPSQRFMAVRHHMQIESPAAELPAMWESVKTSCERLDCLIETSELRRETPRSPAAAYLSLRVNPRDFAALTAALGGNAKVLNHQTSSEDKTGEVVDVEAQIKNRSEYRDSLRELLREKNVKRTLSDLMEIRDTLSNVQAEIDAAQAQRKLLERDTAKQLVTMSFQPERVIASGTYSPWQQTWRRSWDSLTGNMQSMVITAAGALPWLIMLLVVGVPVWLGLRKRSRRSQRAMQVVTTADTQR